MAKFLDDLYVTGNNATVLTINSNAVANILLVSNAGAVAVGSNNFVGSVYSNPKFIINTGSGIPGLMHLNSFGVELVTFTNVGNSLFGNASNHDLSFLTNNVERIKVTASGAVGINHLIPPAQLTVVGAGNTPATHALRIGNSSSAILLNIQDSGNINIGLTNSISTNAGFKIDNAISNNIFNITETGKVGIGLLTVPNGAKLHVINSTSETFIARFETSFNNPVFHIKDDETIGIRITTPEKHLDIRGDVQVRRAQDAYSLGTVIDSFSMYHQGSYWNGALAQSVFIRQQLLVTSTSPTYKLNFTNHIGGIIGSFANNGDITFNGLSGLGTRVLNVDSTGKLVTGVSASSMVTVIGIGTQNFHTKWDSSGSALLDSVISDNGTNVTVSTFLGTGDRMVESASTGVITATKIIINTYGIPNTVKLKLENTLNWDVNGNFTGASTSPPTNITGTYQGQKHYNDNYFYEAVANNIFIRLIRG